MKAIIEFVLRLLIIFKISYNSNKDEVQYYEDLIVNETLKCSKYNNSIYASECNLESNYTTDFGSYDFVIVGGGLAGSVLAARLSEEQAFSVLVLEAGERENDYVDIPALNAMLIHSKFNWGFKTTSQKEKLSDNPNSKCEFPRGKVLGGSTGINGLMNIRGTRKNYDKWTELGNTGWSYNDLLPYFKKYENISAIEGLDTDYHGFDGPITIEPYRNTSNITKNFMEAMGTFGYNITDYNGENLIGINYSQFTRKNGRRLTSAAAYLFPIENRNNLKVMTESFVTRLLMDKDGRKAKGVEFINNHKKYVVTTSKEVILSAGAIKSPQILMVSGIGPTEVLHKFNIPLLKNLPVGKNLYDHLYVAGAMNVSTNYSEEKRRIKNDVIQYLKKFGRLTITVGNIEGIGFISHENYSVTEVLVAPTSAIYTVKNGKIVISAGEYAIAQGSCVLLHPKSVGTVTLKSADPLAFPLIDPNYLSEEDDLHALVETLDFLAQVYQSEPMKKYNATIIPETNFCSNYTFRSFDYWKCVIQYYGRTIYHPIGTCRMGVKQENSVVNDSLIVHGTINIRIVDASVITSTVSGHLMPAIYAIAEKSADMIKRQYATIN